MITSDIIFDTRVDTKKLFVSVKTNFKPRNELDRNGNSLIYLVVSGHNKRQRINIDLRVDPKKWDKKKQRLTSKDEKAKSYNLILDTIQAKITSINTTYYLTQKHLNVPLFVEEFVRGIPRVDFISFADYYLEKQKVQLASGTLRRHKSVLKKLRKFKKQIFFTEIDHNFILRLRAWMGKRGNLNTTIESNIAVVKKYLNAAKKSGIVFSLDPLDIKIGNTNGNRVDLKASEIKKLLEYYNTQYISDKYRLVLGYFLFACFTGLRISEVQSIDRSEFNEEYFEFFEMKNQRYRRHAINNSTREILLTNKALFVKKITNEKLNLYIKECMSHCGIRKKVSFHTARHTFATNFLRMGGDVVSLKTLLGHSKIDQTMIYVHIVEQEVNDKVFIMDKLID